jgi:hypothetical protein
MPDAIARCGDGEYADREPPLAPIGSKRKERAERRRGAAATRRSHFIIASLLRIARRSLAETPADRLPLTLEARGEAMAVITCIEDLRQLHRKRAPKAFYEYVDAGSYSEDTYRANSVDLAALKLRQRVAFDIAVRSTESTMLGETVHMPTALAPVGLTGMQWADGEILAARAAEKFGVPFTLSTMSICSIEDVA